jgi:hypothetical protein
VTSDAEFIPAAIAATASGAFPSALAADEANALFAGMLRDVALGCVGAGSSMIGHIKANVRSGNELLSMSVTTDDGNVRSRYRFGNGVHGYSMTVNVIVYGIERHKAAEILVSNVRRVLGGVSIEVHSEVGCEDPECDDPMCARDEHKRIITIG